MSTLLGEVQTVKIDSCLKSEYTENTKNMAANNKPNFLLLGSCGVIFLAWILYLTSKFIWRNHTRV